MLEEANTIRELQVPREIGQINYEIEQLEKSIADLASRLERVLRPSTPSEEKEDNKSHEELVPLADQLHISSVQLSRLNDSVRSLTSRLEI